jgi:hypothetical protein
MEPSANSQLSFLIDKMFSRIAVSKIGSKLLENTISENSADEIFDIINSCDKVIQSKINSDIIFFRWVFNTDASLQANLGDISVVVYWSEPDADVEGHAQLEAKKTKQKLDLIYRKLDSGEQEKLPAHEKSKIPVKYLLYSIDKFEEKTFNFQTIDIRAKCVLPDRIKEPFVLDPKIFTTKDDYTVGYQITERYLQRKDLLTIKNGKKPKKLSDDEKALLDSIRKQNTDIKGSVLLISKSQLTADPVKDFSNFKNNDSLTIDFSFEIKKIQNNHSNEGYAF